MKLPSYNDYRNIKKIADCKMGGIMTRIENRIKSNPEGSNYLVKDGNDFFPKKMTLSENFKNSLQGLIAIPKRLLIFCAEKLHETFPKFKPFEKFIKSDFVQKYRQHRDLHDDLASLRGVYGNAAKLIKEFPTLECWCGKDEALCQKISSNFDKAFNEALGWGKPKYATKDERFVTRLVSGLTAAAFMGTDFLNNALKLGKSEEEAKKDMRQKTMQETIANIGEAISQFCFLATFPLLANTKKWAAPVASAAIGFVFNVVSRLMAGMPLTRKDAPKTQVAPTAPTFGTMTMPKNVEEFADRVKTETLNKKPANIQPQQETKKKEPLLSLKNILIACGVSIAGGFALRRFKTTSIFKELENSFNNTYIGKKISDIKTSQIKKIYTDQKEVNELRDALSQMGEEKLANNIQGKMEKTLKEAEGCKIPIGTRYAITKDVEMPRHKLHRMIFAPLEFVIDVIAFPYKKASALAESLGWIKEAEKSKLIIDEFEIKNLILKFRELQKEHEGDKTAFTNAFRDCVQKAREAAANNITLSKIDNQKLSVTASLAGMLSGIYFNMNDDANKVIDNGGTQEEADKAARLRGLNKFSRTSIQAVIAGTLNGVLVKYYNMSLAKSSVITLAATALTEVACRFMVGMPFNKMTKEEQAAYKEAQEKGFAGKYFKMIDKLAE